MDNEMNSNVQKMRKRQGNPQRSKLRNYDSMSPTSRIKTESTVEFDTISENDLRNDASNIECIPSSGENLISAIWGAEGFFLLLLV